jgi:hypothetical protein
MNGARATAILRHRFVAVPLVLVLLVIGWNIHVAANNQGIVTGTVQDTSGRPVAGAEVVFFERDFVNYQEKLRATTDGHGRYRFDGVQTHIGQLEARLADGRRSERQPLRLWFRAQNREADPLVVPRS